MSRTFYDDAADRAMQATRNGVHTVGEAVDRVTDQASELVHRSSDWAREGGQRMRSELVRASDRTLRNVRDDPVRTVLMAAAAGALIFALVRMVGSRNHR